MAKFQGAVRFPDGAVFTIIYDGFIETVRPRIFADEVASSEAWDDPQDNFPISMKTQPGDEMVDVFHIYAPGHEVNFRTTASREKMLITGPRTAEQAVEAGYWNEGDESLHAKAAGVVESTMPSRRRLKP